MSEQQGAGEGGSWMCRQGNGNHGKNALLPGQLEKGSSPSLALHRNHVSFLGRRATSICREASALRLDFADTADLSFFFIVAPFLLP